MTEICDPLPNLPLSYNIDEISQTGKNVKLLLSFIEDKNKKLVLLFEDSAVFYRRTNESFWLWPDINTDGQQETIYGLAMIIANSPIIQELSEESFGTVRPDMLTHFLFFDLDTITEVIATAEPKVEWICYVK